MAKYRKFEWQEGYGAFSVSASQVKKTITYINGQKEHHRKRTFKEEFIQLLDNIGSNTICAIRIPLDFSRPFHGLDCLIDVFNPALKCWAIISRPLARTRSEVFPTHAGFLRSLMRFRLTAPLSPLDLEQRHRRTFTRHQQRPTIQTIGDCFTLLPTAQ